MVHAKKNAFNHNSLVELGPSYPGCTSESNLNNPSRCLVATVTDIGPVC